MRKLEFKDEFLAFWGDNEEARDKIAEAAILEAFREGLITSERASRLLDISEQKFMKLLSRKKVPCVTFQIDDENDWMSDPDILEVLMERDSLIEKEIKEGCFSTLEDFTSELGF